MNRTEAKAYALNELGLTKDQVRRYGNLNYTQTWLNAIAAQNALLSENEIAISPSEVIVEDAIAPHEVVIVEDGIALQTAIAQDSSFETFWDSASALLQPQPLLNISVLDEDWDEPEPAASPASEVIVYPLVIGLLMLWAMVQLLLLAGRGIAVGLTALANALDAAASHRLQAAPSRLHPQLGLRKTTLALG